MAILTIPDLKLQIDAEINTNGVQAITGALLNKNLIDSIDSILDAASGLGANGIFDNSNNGSTIPASMIVNINDTLAINGGALTIENGIYQTGYRVFHTSITGYNVFLGRDAGNITMTGDGNFALGPFTLANNTTGLTNIAIGLGALFSNQTGGFNTVIGGGMFFSSAGSNNTIIGNGAGFNISGDRNIMLGQDAGRNQTGSDKLYIHNGLGVTNLATGVTNSLIYGEFNAVESSQVLRFNSKVGLGINPSQRLELPLAEWAAFNSNPSTTDFGGIRFQENGSPTYGGRIYQNGQSDRLTITAMSAGVDTGGIYIARGTGRVGMQRGSAGFAPQSTLHLKGEALIDVLLVEDSLSRQGLRVLDGGNVRLSNVVETINYAGSNTIALIGKLGHGLTDYALLISSTSTTAAVLNAPTGKQVEIRNNNVSHWTFNASGQLHSATNVSGMKLRLAANGYGFGTQSELLEVIIKDATADCTIGYGTSGSLTRLATFQGDGVVNFNNLPTSSAGLSAGDLWNNSGVVNIV